MLARGVRGVHHMRGPAQKQLKRRREGLRDARGRPTHGLGGGGHDARKGVHLVVAHGDVERLVHLARQQKELHGALADMNERNEDVNGDDMGKFIRVCIAWGWE
jgi:hypothetical protein